MPEIAGVGPARARRPFLGRLAEQYRTSNKVGYVMVLPYIAHFLLFTAYPLVFAFILVFNRWDIVTPMEFIGLRNIQRLFRDATFWTAVVNTLKFLCCHIPLQIVLSLLIAVILNGPIKFRSFFRGAFFLPFVISGAVVTILWQQLYSTDAGILNLLLTRIGMQPVPWLTDPAWAIYSIAIMATWKNMGFYIVLFLAGLQNVPPELYEAASIDGANRTQQFWGITLPLLQPVMLLVAILSTIGGFSLFIEPFVMTGGGPAESTLSVVLYLYKQAFQFLRMGYAATIGFALAIMIFIVTFIQRRLLDTDQPV